MDALGRVSANFDKGDIFLTSYLLSYAPIPFWKGKLYKKKSIWDQILSFLSRPLSERKTNNLTKLYPLKVYQFPLSPANCIDVLWISFFYLFFVFKGNLLRYLTYIRVWCLVRDSPNWVVIYLYWYWYVIIVRVSLLTMPNLGHMREMLLFVLSKMAD